MQAFARAAADFPANVELAARIEANDVEECGRKLERGEVDAVVMERDFMTYWARKDGWAKTAGLGFSPDIATVPIGLMFSENAASQDFNKELNLALMDKADSDVLWRLHATWFAEAPKNTLGMDELQWNLVGPALALLVIYCVGEFLAAWFPSESRKFKKALDAAERNLKLDALRDQFQNIAQVPELAVKLDRRRSSLAKHVAKLTGTGTGVSSPQDAGSKATDAADTSHVDAHAEDIEAEIISSK